MNTPSTDAQDGTANGRIPPLENGDRLTRAEFERRYDAMKGLKKAELIEGVVYVPSPTRFIQHGGPHFDLVAWFGMFRMATPGVRGGDNTTARLDLDNEPQPDILLLIEPVHGGQALIDADGYITGAPELVAEVSASNVSHDLHAKLNVYRRNGVREYLVWRVLDQQIDWFVLREGQFVRLVPDNGILKSEGFPGLWLDPDALIRGDMARLSAVAQQGLATPEHGAFVRRLHAALSP